MDGIIGVRDWDGEGNGNLKLQEVAGRTGKNTSWPGGLWKSQEGHLRSLPVLLYLSLHLITPSMSRPLLSSSCLLYGNTNKCLFLWTFQKSFGPVGHTVLWTPCPYQIKSVTSGNIFALGINYLLIFFCVKGSWAQCVLSAEKVCQSGWTYYHWQSVVHCKQLLCAAIFLESIVFLYIFFRSQVYLSAIARVF